MAELLGAVGLSTVLLVCVTRDLLRVHGLVLRELESLDPSGDELVDSDREGRPG